MNDAKHYDRRFIKEVSGHSNKQGHHQEFQEAPQIVAAEGCAYARKKDKKSGKKILGYHPAG